jgi:hypothetical protein
METPSQGRPGLYVDCVNLLSHHRYCGMLLLTPLLVWGRIRHSAFSERYPKFSHMGDVTGFWLGKKTFQRNTLLVYTLIGVGK